MANLGELEFDNECKKNANSWADEEVNVEISKEKKSPPICRAYNTRCKRARKLFSFYSWILVI